MKKAIHIYIMVRFRKGDFLKAFSGLQSWYNVIPKKGRVKGKQKRSGKEGESVCNGPKTETRFSVISFTKKI